MHGANMSILRLFLIDVFRQYLTSTDKRERTIKRIFVKCKMSTCWDYDKRHTLMGSA